MNQIPQSAELRLRAHQDEAASFAHTLYGFTQELRHVSVKGYTVEELEIFAQEIEGEILAFISELPFDVVNAKAQIWADGGGILDSSDDLLRHHYEYNVEAGR